MPRKRLFQIRLRTLLAIMFVAALGALWYGRQWREEHRRHAAIEYLTKRGATVRIVPSLRGTMAEVTFSYAWMEFSGDPAPAIPTGVRREHSAWDLTLEDFEQLRLVPRLTALSLEGVPLTPETLAGIATLDSLERIDIGHTPLDDDGLQALAPLSKLRELNLEATQVTDAGVQRLTAALPNLVVNDD